MTPAGGGRRRGNRRAAKGALVLVSTAVTLLVLELVLRSVWPQATYGIRLAPWGFEHIPGISFTHATEVRQTYVTVRYNRDGFRGAGDVPGDKQRDVLRVAILGDSFAEGVEVEERDLHSTRLEAHLRGYLATRPGRYRSAEVINAGVYAYDTCQELRLFEAHVARYRPDVVFLMYTEELEPFPFCRLEHGRLAYVDLPYSRGQYLARYGLGYVKAKSHLAALALGKARTAVNAVVPLPPPLDHTFPFALPEPPGRRPRASGQGIDVYTHMPDGVPVERLTADHPLLFAVLDRLTDSVGAAGGQLIVVFSHRPVVGHAVAAHLRDRGVSFVDVYSYLEDHATESTRVPHDGHWNPHGHAVVAQALFEVLRSHL